MKIEKKGQIKKKMSRFCVYFFLLLFFVIFLTIFENNFLFENSLSFSKFNDKKFKHCIIKNIFESSKKIYFDEITLILHSSPEKIGKNLIKQIENWNAPVILIVSFDLNFFDPKLLPCFWKMFDKIFSVSKIVKKHLTVHYLIQNETEFCQNWQEKLKIKTKCQDFYPAWRKFYKKLFSLPFVTKVS